MGMHITGAVLTVATTTVYVYLMIMEKVFCVHTNKQDNKWKSTGNMLLDIIYSIMFVNIFYLRKYVNIFIYFILYYEAIYT